MALGGPDSVKCDSSVSIPEWSVCGWLLVAPENTGDVKVPVGAREGDETNSCERSMMEQRRVV